MHHERQSTEVRIRNGEWITLSELRESTPKAFQVCFIFTFACACPARSCFATMFPPCDPFASLQEAESRLLALLATPPLTIEEGKTILFAAQVLLLFFPWCFALCFSFPLVLFGWLSFRTLTRLCRLALATVLAFVVPCHGRHRPEVADLGPFPAVGPHLASLGVCHCACPSPASLTHICSWQAGDNAFYVYAIFPRSEKVCFSFFSYFSLCRDCFCPSLLLYPQSHLTPSLHCRSHARWFPSFL